MSGALFGGRVGLFDAATPTSRRWTLRWRATWPDGHVSWYQNDALEADEQPMPSRARLVARMQHPTARVAHVTVRPAVGVPRHGADTYAIPAPKGAKR